MPTSDQNIPEIDLSTGRNLWAKLVSGAAILAVAGVSGVISYGHIEALSVALHQTVLAARLMPVAIDGLIVIGSVILLQSGARLGWLGVGPGLALSVFANLESGLRFGALSAIWAAIPSLSFFLATYIFERWLKAQARAGAGVPATVTEQETVADSVPPDVPGIEPVSAPVGTVPTAPETVGWTVADGVPGVPGAYLNGSGLLPVEAEPFAADLARGEVPSIRRIRAALRCGQPKAQEVQARLSALTVTQ